VFRKLFFPLRKVRKIVTWVYDDSIAQLIFVYIHLVDLRCRCPLDRSLGNRSEENVALLRVGKILTMENLQFLVLFDKGDNQEAIVGERSPVDGI
jgi:hypothetical protein